MLGLGLGVMDFPGLADSEEPEDIPEPILAQSGDEITDNDGNVLLA